jgi:hypothetical protein
LLLLGGCDLAFGVGGEPDPCDLGTFDSARTTDIAPAFRFSVDWDQRFAVVEHDDTTYAELALPDATETPIDLGLYATINLALAPEGSALLYTTTSEPMQLEGALRGGPGEWTLGARAPAATFVGTPSADVFGPRRMIARMHEYDDNVQELEDRNGTWVPVGEAHPLAGDLAPNLTPNGLTAVFTRSVMLETGVVLDVYGATRPSTDEWFGDPVKILDASNDRAPQLLGHCDRLYTVHDGMLRRYDR